MIALLAVAALLAGINLDCHPRAVPADPEIIVFYGVPLIAFGRLDAHLVCSL